MKYKILLMLLGLFIIGQISAIQVEINVRGSFNTGDLIYFNYSIFSEKNMEIKFIPIIECQKEPIALYDEITYNLIGNDALTEGYTDTGFNKNFESQYCNASIIVTKPIYEKFSRSFYLNGTPIFNFNIKLDKKVFYSGDKVNINYESEVDGINIKASLTYPDGSIQNVNLPYSFTASKIGTYELNVEASKEGYKTITKKEQFGVIEKQIGARGIGFYDASICNADGACNGRENNQNCPQDCPAITELPEALESRDRFIFYIAMIILLEVGLAMTLYRVLKKNPKVNKKTKK